ncbi:MAG: Rieske (2Fe-2S) protein [Bacteroidia bacterium]
MDRKNFLKTCGFACAGAFLGVSLLEGCSSIRSVNANIEGDDMVLPVSDFEVRKGESLSYHKAVVARNQLLQFPICVFRNGADDYAAVWMSCTHQGAELQLFGDRLQCPAHGSEFDSHGQVANGPASKALRSFPIVMEGNQLKISLK